MKVAHQRSSAAFTSEKQADPLPSKTASSAQQLRPLQPFLLYVAQKNATRTPTPSAADTLVTRRTADGLLHLQVATVDLRPTAYSRYEIPSICRAAIPARRVEISPFGRISALQRQGGAPDLEEQ